MMSGIPFLRENVFFPICKKSSMSSLKVLSLFSPPKRDDKARFAVLVYFFVKLNSIHKIGGFCYPVDHYYYSQFL